MNSKERVLTTIHHQEPDRVPIGWAHTNRDIDRRLKEYFGLQQNDDNGLLEALHVDTRQINVNYTGPVIHKSIEDIRVDPLFGIRTRWIENESGGYWDYCDFPLKDASLEDVEAWPMPSADHFDYSVVPELCQKHKDYCVIYGDAGIADIINSTGMLRTMEQVLMDLALEDPVGLRLFERKCAAQLAVMERSLDAAKGGIDMIWMGEDLGTQHSPILSLDMYRKHLRPLHQKFIDLARSYDLPVMIHSCGSSSWAFNDMIEMGINIVDTLQPEAKDMDPAYLKKTYDDKLCFHGCISTAGPMAYGTVQETVDNVKETLDVMMPGGGYIMAPTHMLQDNTPTENAVAAFNAVLEYGTY